MAPQSNRMGPRSIVAGLTALALVGLGALALTQLRTATASPPRLEVAPAEHDFGELATDGRESTTFTVQNSGKVALEINNISTSCGCTTAGIDQFTIPPGGSTNLRVTVDHELMPTEGAFEHVVFLASNDPGQPEVLVEVRGVGVSEGGAATAPQISAPATARGSTTAAIYYNDACADCLEYIADTLVPALADHGVYEAALFDYLKERENRVELNRRNQSWGIPFELQSHLMTFVGEQVVLAGHVPTEMIAETLTGRPTEERIIVYQDRMPEMRQAVTEYK